MVVFAQMGGDVKAAALGWTSGGSTSIYWVIPRTIHIIISWYSSLVLEEVVELVAVAVAVAIVVAAVSADAAAAAAVVVVARAAALAAVDDITVGRLHAAA